MGKLSREDIWACAPAMPMADAPKKDEWVKELARQVGNPNEGIFLVGHSLGVCGILGYLESLPENSKIGGALLVSGPIHPLGGQYSFIDHFMDKEFNYEHIKKICKKFVVIHGDNDTTVPFSQAQELAKNLSCELTVIPNGGHLNGSSGWYKLPEALEALHKMFK